MHTQPTPKRSRPKSFTTAEDYAARFTEGNLPEAYRQIAMNIEEALAKDGKGVSLEKPLANIVTRALWDFADRVELDLE